MNIFRHLHEIKYNPNTVLTMGTFDGIHLGHQEILKRMFEISRINNSRNFLITFHPHPKKIISPGEEIKILSTSDEKISMLNKMGLENLFIINFTKEFSQQPPIEFFKKYIINGIGIKAIVIGYDHRFGKSREGTHQTLKALAEEFGFEIHVVNEFKLGEHTVNSTQVRKAIGIGKIENANLFLGREYSFSGIVVQGDKRGKILGFPTANILIDDNDKLLPDLGIYAAYVQINEEEYHALLSIGRRPTFYDNGDVITEAYIYNFNKNIYGEKITVKLLARIRSEEKFSSAEELVHQMNRDKEAGLNIFNQIQHLKN